MEWYDRRYSPIFGDTHCRTCRGRGSVFDHWQRCIVTCPECQGSGRMKTKAERDAEETKWRQALASSPSPTPTPKSGQG